MTRPIEVATRRSIRPFAEVGHAGSLDRLCGAEGPWEVELGFGKGRFLLSRAAGEPERRFLGIEIAREYFALVAKRLARRGLVNLALLHGEALYLLSAGLPRRFASVVHVYFPDPWPKSRHLKRRLFSPASVDLVLGLLEPGGGSASRRIVSTTARRSRSCSRPFPDSRRGAAASPGPMAPAPTTKRSTSARAERSSGSKRC